MADYRNPPPGSKLELYIKESCPYCQEARAYYDAHHIPYVTHDAQRDRAARERMFAYTGGNPTVPAIVLDGRYLRSGWGEPPRG